MPIILTCQTCGEQFATTPSEATRRGGARFCSHSCRSRNLDIQGRIAAKRTGERQSKLPRDGTVERLYAEGKTCQEIADQFGCKSDESVRMYLIRRGVARRGKSAKDTSGWAARRKLAANDEIAQMYRDGQSTAAIAAHFGLTDTTICARLRAMGISRRRSFYGGDATWRCNDGHIVRSNYEQIVDNWLWAHRVAHAYEPPLPFSNAQRADFLARGVYIEIWGVTGSDDYAERRRVKQEAYAAAGLHLISLYPRHILDELERHLAPLLDMAD